MSSFTYISRGFKFVYSLIEFDLSGGIGIYAAWSQVNTVNSDLMWKVFEHGRGRENKHGRVV
jgi:hypothetical protein